MLDGFSRYQAVNTGPQLGHIRPSPLRDLPERELILMTGWRCAPMSVVEFVCEGCGLFVFAYGRSEPPSHRLCAVCEWCCEHVAPEEIMEMRRRCEPGGWESERDRRAYRMEVKQS